MLAAPEATTLPQEWTERLPLIGQVLTALLVPLLLWWATQRAFQAILIAVKVCLYLSVSLGVLYTLNQEVVLTYWDKIRS